MVFFCLCDNALWHASVYFPVQCARFRRKFLLQNEQHIMWVVVHNNGFDLSFGKRLQWCAEFNFYLETCNLKVNSKWNSLMLFFPGSSHDHKEHYRLNYFKLYRYIHVCLDLPWAKTNVFLLTDFVRKPTPCCQLCPFKATVVWRHYMMALPVRNNLRSLHRFIQKFNSPKRFFCAAAAKENKVRNCLQIFYEQMNALSTL